MYYVAFDFSFGKRHMHGEYFFWNNDEANKFFDYLNRHTTFINKPYIILRDNLYNTSNRNNSESNKYLYQYYDDYNYTEDYDIYLYSFNEIKEILNKIEEDDILMNDSDEPYKIKIVKNPIYKTADIPMSSLAYIQMLNHKHQ